MADTSPLGSNTTPLNGDAPIADTPFDDKARLVVFLAIFAGYVSFTFFAAYRPVDLPGDTTGIVIQNWSNLLMLCVGFYFGLKAGKK